MVRGIEHSGAWVIAIFVIVIASWLLYKYLAPKTWREWTGAGLIQAFIIALYAEMYGFPLTIYLLVRFLGVDRGYADANLWSTLLGMGQTGMMISIILGYTLLARKEEQKVIEKFGEEYLEYKWNVPAFFPVKGKWKQLIQRSGNTD